MRAKRIRTGMLSLFAWTIASLPDPAMAQTLPAPAGQVVVDSVNRLYLNPGDGQVLLAGYFATIDGLQNPLFAGTPGEVAAHFTWFSESSGATVLQNGDITGIVLNPGDKIGVYYNSAPNQSWTDPRSFAGGQLVATFRTAKGTQASVGPVFLVTRSFVLESSRNFVFKGQTFNFRRLIPHGFTLSVLGSNVPLADAGIQGFPLVFAVAGSGAAIGGELSSFPRFF